MSCLATLTRAGHIAVCVPEIGDVRHTHTHIPNQFQRMNISSNAVIAFPVC